MITLSEALRGVMLRDELGDGDRFVLEQAAEALEHAGGSPIPPFKLFNETTQEGAHYLCRAKYAQDATLDAEAEALMQEWAGDEANLDWQNITANGRIEWRRVAQKAREMHRKTASLDECVRVYGHSIGTPRDCLRAVLYRLGVEVTP